MEITSIVVRKDCVVVRFDTKDKKLKLSYDLYTNNFLYVGKDIDEKLFEKLKKQCVYDNGLQWAKSYLTNKFVSTYQLKKKLEAKRIPYKYISSIIKKVKDLKLLDDEEYCSYILEVENNKNRGKHHIINRLYNAGIPYSIINNIMFPNDNEKTKMHRKIKRYHEKKNNNKLNDRNLYTYLLQNGFDEELINEYINDNFLNV